MNFKFTKLSGAGNDFILFDGINNNIPNLNESRIKSLCRRGLGIGADGILVLMPSNDYDYELKYFNMDGSSGMLCANGARSSLIYARQNLNINKKNIVFECCGKIYSGETVAEDEAVVNLPDIKEGKDEILEVNKMTLPVYVVNTGAPHAVVNFSDLPFAKSQSFENFDFYNFALLIRNHISFKPEGVNVNVIAFSKSEIKIRSFERGIEDETLACGTGIVASAMFLHTKLNKELPVEIISRSGKKFVINFTKNLTNFESVSLRGHAAVVYTGNISL